MKGHGSKFEQKKEEAIVALLTQRNIEEAALVHRSGAQHPPALDEGTGVRCSMPGGAPGRIPAIGRTSSAGLRCSRHDTPQAHD